MWGKNYYAWERKKLLLLFLMMVFFLSPFLYSCDYESAQFFASSVTLTQGKSTVNVKNTLQIHIDGELMLFVWWWGTHLYRTLWPIRCWVLFNSNERTERTNARTEKKRVIQFTIMQCSNNCNSLIQKFYSHIFTHSLHLHSVVNWLFSVRTMIN